MQNAHSDVGTTFKKTMNKIIAAASSMTIALGLISCTTTYDAAGRPVQSVDPGAAAVGVVGAGLLGAAIASNNKSRHRHHRRGHYDYYRHRGHYHRTYHRGRRHR